jgi:hypothetical protein
MRDLARWMWRWLSSSASVPQPGLACISDQAHGGATISVAGATATMAVAGHGSATMGVSIDADC